MQFSTIFSIAATLFAAVNADSVSYDTGYDIGSRPLTDVACSDGPNGLITRYGWQTQGEVGGTVVKFPYIGGVQAVGGWNSAACGSCWELEYNGKSIHIIAVDHSGSGFNIALDAMNDLTNGNAVALGRVDATATQVDVSECGL